MENNIELSDIRGRFGNSGVNPVEENFVTLDAILEQVQKYDKV